MSLIALALAAALQTPGGVTSTPVADLIGLTPSEVAARLGAAPDPAPGDALRIIDGERVVEIHPIQRFWREPTMHGDLGVRPESVICLSGILPSAGEPAAGSARGLLAASRGQFVFIDGRLRSVHVTPPRSDSRPTPRNAREGGPSAGAGRRALRGQSRRVGCRSATRPRRSRASARPSMRTP